MAQKRIKVKELAQELGLTARQLLERCRAEGIAVQNSITKLRPHTVVVVRSWFRKDSPVTRDAYEPSDVDRPPAEIVHDEGG